MGKKELFWVVVEGLIHAIPLYFSIPFTSILSIKPVCRASDLIHPDQKLLYLFTPKKVVCLLKAKQSESECILVRVHAHTASRLGGAGGGAG